MTGLNEHVRERLREEVARKGISQRDLGQLMGGWSQSRVGKLLTGRVEITLNDLETICFALGIRVTEIVRDRGMEFYAEMTTTEFRVFERIRDTPGMIDAVKALIDLREPVGPSRRASVKKKTAKAVR